MLEGFGTGDLLQRFQVLFTAGTTVGLTDRELLERILHVGGESAEAAFTALVERHGPMVLRVCNQALRDPHAAEDAFQATFLVLARQAGSIRGRDSVESWLFGVACRAAARIRMTEARRQRYERRSAIVQVRKELIEAENDEAQSRLKMKLVQDKLRVHGLTENEIESAKNQDGVQKAKMVLRSPDDGFVTIRDVVAGNYYYSTDNLLVIARDDVLSVRASVESRYAGQLEVGHRVTVKDPFSDQTIDGTVQAISRDATPETGTVTVRASIPNPNRRLKAGMLVQLGVELGPKVQSTDVAKAPTQRKSNLSLEARLNEVERKLSQLLDEKDSRFADSKILERLSELERKLDRALNPGTRN